MDIYIVASDGMAVWAINPANRQRLRIKPASDRNPVLDVIPLKTGIYHAAEVVKKELVRYRGQVYIAQENFVRVDDTISGSSVVTINPREVTPAASPIDKVVDISFRFFTDDQALGYVLNGREKVLFGAGYERSSTPMFAKADGNTITYSGRVVATLENRVVHLHEMSGDQLARAFRLKNRFRYDKNRGFFR